MEKKTILIVDDNADTRLILSARLKAHYRTVFAADAIQVMPVALRERPDAILLDLGLPGGDGLNVLQRLQSNTFLKSIPVIIVTAEDPQSAEAHSLQAGAVAFLQKPVNHDKLLAAVQHAIGRADAYA
jgi:two-component system, sensor histidine kinase ChiS